MLSFLGTTLNIVIQVKHRKNMKHFPQACSVKRHPRAFVLKWCRIYDLYSFQFHSTFHFLSVQFSKGLLRLQQIYQGLNPGNETFQVEIVKRINNASEAIEFLQKIEQLNRWSKKYVVLDCPTEMAKEIVKNHVRDVSLGKRTYHYLLSGLVSIIINLRLIKIAKNSHHDVVKCSQKILRTQ